jgi:hypothetical protein
MRELTTGAGLAESMICWNWWIADSGVVDSDIFKGLSVFGCLNFPWSCFLLYCWQASRMCNMDVLERVT